MQSSCWPTSSEVDQGVLTDVQPLRLAESVLSDLHENLQLVAVQIPLPEQLIDDLRLRSCFEHPADVPPRTDEHLTWFVSQTPSTWRAEARSLSVYRSVG